MCSNIYPDKTYPQLTFDNISHYGLYEAHRLGQSQLFTPRVYESGNSPDLRDRHHIHQMVTSASPTSGSSRHRDQAGSITTSERAEFPKRENWGVVCFHTGIPYILIYKSRNLSQNKILHRQFVLYTGNTLREEIIPKESLFFNRRVSNGER